MGAQRKGGRGLERVFDVMECNKEKENLKLGPKLGRGELVK